MWFFEPSKLAGKSEAWLLEDGYMHSQKAQVEFALANVSSVPDQSALSGAVDCVADEVGIQLSTDELANILSLYPLQRGKLASYGWGDTEVREQILDAVANFMANTRWPQGKDDVDLKTFIERLKAAARFLGYTINEMS
ncbi:hypothetical protein ALQ64_03170 [Pseudomonas cannabina]|uniref:Uncharacterized protein n=1 Tax=Pseudomonas cannabina TaxID=86840 RepID=A0A3M3K1W6_PSECA|nr:hypothetical protein [Pseudomonas cannabina]RMN17104.1 hypothetical protein ALQ64_03170 [Pseudomonas cannabina]